MAKKREKTSAFTVQAWITCVLLAGAAGLLYWQGDGDNADRHLPELAVLSQAIPLHAANAFYGEPEGFDRLAESLTRLKRLERSRHPAPPGVWAEFEQRAEAVLGRRDDVRAIQEAVTFVDEHMPQLLQLSDEVLSNSGAAKLVPTFEQHAVNVQEALRQLLPDSAGEAIAGDVAGDLQYLQQVLDALGGEATSLDIAAIDPDARETSLVPLVNALEPISQRVEQAQTGAAALGDLRADVEALTQTSASLYDPLTTSGPLTGLRNWLSHPWLPLSLVGLALLMVGILALMHARTAVFERASKEQTEQNERNQQAILRLLDELGSLADGDLTVEATVTEDITGAIADSINYAIEKLRELVATINETAIMVDSAAKQTESTAVHMARAAKNQNSEIRAATESIESMASSIEEVSGNAERSSDVARHSVDVAHKGGEAVRRTIDGMNTIRETIQDTSKRIKRLGESSQEIGNIVELINDIAEQTNILALNASIQASMAGEAGRGFAVVADEVQRLAERSTNATKQIEVLVRTIQADTNEAVVSMERSTTDVVGGALLAENAGAALDEIEQVSNQIASLVQNISGSAREQAGSAADVTRRTARLKEISDQTGKATTATAAAISKLSILASQLRETVSGFTLPKSVFASRALSEARTAADATRKDKVTG